jgi:cytochrome c553
VKLRICGLANIVGSAALILVCSFSGVGLAETLIERGSYLVNTIGACGNCHARDTAFNRTLDLAGGATEDREFGHVVISNITPDPETGIGKWTQAEILVALRDGKRPDGSIIGPPMPIPVYRQLSDHDAEAISAYLLSLKPVKNPLTRSQYTITLPPSYGSPITHVDEPVTTDKVAYGSYLVGFGHCVLCHTPPGDDKPFNMSLAFAGGREFPRYGDIAPSVSRNITPDPEDGIGKWRDTDRPCCMDQPGGRSNHGPTQCHAMRT